MGATFLTAFCSFRFVIIYCRSMFQGLKIQFMKSQIIVVIVLYNRTTIM